MDTVETAEKPIASIADSTRIDWSKALIYAVRLGQHKPGFETKRFADERAKLVGEVFVADAEAKRMMQGEPTHQDHHKLARIWDKLHKDTKAMCQRHGLRL